MAGAASAEPAAAPASPLAVPLDAYGKLLTRYVTPGGVRYETWRANSEDVKALSDVVAKLSAIDPRKLSSSDRFALYIDLYNAKVLEIVLTENPKKSIKEVNPGITGFGVFLKPVLDLAGEKDKISLRHLEDRLREEAKDPRVHFAINCASRSCPPIASEPYRGEALDQQLERSAKAFLASQGALVLDAEKGADGKETVTLRASKIFDWYAKDFKVKGGGLAFIEQYGPPSMADALKKAGKAAKLEFQDYDWSLNTAS